MEVSIQAGTPEAPSIAVALENYLKNSTSNLFNPPGVKTFGH
ncbi:MAG: hypothetical protein R2792_06560 [Saprospiraceae bacterium]